MELFKTLNKIEDGIRRSKVEKSGTEKMGVPHVMGAGDRSEILSDTARSEKESVETEESEEKSSCEKSLGLLGALNFMGAAKKGGVVLPFSENDLMGELEKTVTDPRYKQKKPPKTPKGKLTPTERQMQEVEAKRKKAEWKGAEPKPSAKKKTSAKKTSQKKKTSAKKTPTARKQRKSPPKKSASGPGSGQAGRTGKRKRRSVGEFWWAKSGNRPGMDLWTKRESGVIARANKEEKKKYNAERDKRGLEGKVEIETGPEDEHKKRSAMVRTIKKAKGLHRHMTNESWANVLKALKAGGFSVSKKEEEFLRKFLDEAGSFKLSTGMPSRWARKPDQVKRDFVDGMDPQNYRDLAEFNKAKKRIESMSVEQFEAVLRAIVFDEDEDDLRAEYGIKGTWKGVKPQKSFDEALEDIIKSMY